MNRFTRKCLRMSVILFIIGAVFTCVGLVGGATNHTNIMNSGYEYEEYVPVVTSEIFNEMATDVTIDQMDTEYSNDSESDIVSSVDKNGNMNITYQEEYIENLDFNFVASSVQIIPGGTFSINANNINSNFKSYVKNDTWHIEEKSDIDFNTFSEYNSGMSDIISDIVITIPTQQYFNDIEINVQAATVLITELFAEETVLEVVAGTLDIKTMETAELEMSCGAGEIRAYETTVTDVDMECGMGSIEFVGRIEGYGNIECGMGNINMILGTEKDFYNYDINCGMGRINLYGDVYSGLSNKKQIDNDGYVNLDIECGMGNITIN